MKHQQRGVARRIICICLLTIMFTMALPGCGDAGEGTSSGDGQGVYTSIEELEGKRIGIQTGTIFDGLVKKNIKNVELLYYGGFPDLVVALKSNKIDAFPGTHMVLSQYLNEDDSLTILDEEIGRNPSAYVFPKNEKGKALRDQMNEFLAGLRESGELSQIEDKWCSKDESEKVMIDYSALPNVNGRLVFLTEGTFPPYSYIRENITIGYDVDIAARFCKEYGYALDVVDMNFDALMPAVSAGKCDFAASGIAVTEERKEIVYFSEPNIYDRLVFAVLKNETGGGSFLESVSKSFRKTFITEDRYKLFAKGILVTLIINVCSIFFGTLLGFVIYLFCRNGNKIANKIANAVMWVIRGMPGVVLLMLLYYVVFGRISISGIVVSVIAFSITFGTAMYGMLLSGVRAVDPGQAEAAYALGFSDRSTFFHVILPQALAHFLPEYKGEIVALLKASAIVGYITVEDLTRMGDIVRYRTYEPFFPILSVAVMYFVLAYVLTKAVSLMLRHVDPKTRTEKEILRGLSTHGIKEGAEAREAAFYSRGGEAIEAAKTAAESIFAPEAEGAETRPLIEIRHLRKEFENAGPLKDVNAEIRDGDVIAVIGPSGTGKSTLLRCLNLLERPTSGQIFLNGEDILVKGCNVSMVHRKMGMVFQSFNLFGYLTVIENVMYAPIKLLKMSRQEAYDKAMELLRMVGMAEKLFSYPDQLSGGQKQRVAIARALAMEPDIILFDEPTSALDPTMTVEVEEVICGLEKQGKTMMIVTHEMQFARQVSNRVFYLDEGEIYEEGTPKEIFDEPQKERTRRFVWNLKALEIEINPEIRKGPFNLARMADTIDRYFNRNGISPRTRTNLQSVIEELCVQILLPELEKEMENPSIHITIEYSQPQDRAEVTAEYAGNFNPADTDNELAYTVLKGRSKSIMHEVDADKARSTVRIKV